MKLKITYILLLLIIFQLNIGCSKDKVPVPEIYKPTKWEKISGTYKVYDTLGIYLYEMTISHSDSTLVNGNTIDSLKFENLDNLFTLTQYQSPWSNIPEGYIDIGSHNPIVDKNGNRWHLFQPTDLNYNVLIGDTIILRYKKGNILYYLEDLVPYYDDWSKQIAVKQH